MTKDVLISIQGLQVAEAGQDDPIEMVTPGEYYFRDGKHYLVFDEVLEDFSGTTKNRIKIMDNFLDIKKSGVNNVHMTFEKNKKNITCYNTPYGSLMLGIHASFFELEETEEKIDIRVDYALDINYEPMAECKIQISVKAKQM